MNCEYYINLYLRHSRMLFLTKLHTLHCEKCKNEIWELEKKLNSCNNIMPYEMKTDMSDLIMKNISLMLPHNRPSVSPAKWIISGLILAGSIFIMPFNNSMRWVSENFGDNFDIPMTIVMGCGISIYIAFFAASHLKQSGLRGKIDRFFAPKEVQG